MASLRLPLRWRLWLLARGCAAFSRRWSRLWGRTARSSLQAFLWHVVIHRLLARGPSRVCTLLWESQKGNMRLKYSHGGDSVTKGSVARHSCYGDLDHRVTEVNHPLKKGINGHLTEIYLWNTRVPGFIFNLKGQYIYSQQTAEPPEKQAWLWTWLKLIYFNLKKWKRNRKKQNNRNRKWVCLTAIGWWLWPRWGKKKRHIYLTRSKTNEKWGTACDTWSRGSTPNKKTPKHLIGKPKLRRSPKIQTKLSMCSHKTAAHERSSKPGQHGRFSRLYSVPAHVKPVPSSLPPRAAALPAGV